MKLLRYNKDPFQINLDELDHIEAGDTILKVHLKDQTVEYGYLIQA